MTRLDFPALTQTPAQLSWGLVANTQLFQARTLNNLATTALSGDRWSVHLVYQYLPEVDWRALTGFLALLDGEAGRFAFGPYFHAAAPRGAVSGTPTVNGASQTGTSLAVAGLVPSAAKVFRIGDFVSFATPYGSELHQVVAADVDADASGHATLTIAPPIRLSPADGAALVYDNPFCVMKMKDATQGGIGIDPPLLGKISLDFIEVVPKSS